jgi:chromosome segregation ATPase
MSVIIETDLRDILNKLEQRFDKIDLKLEDILKNVTDLKIDVIEVKGEIKTSDEKLSGEIKTSDEKLSGQIKTLDEKLSRQINILDTKVDGLSTRVQNQEFTSRAILGGLLLIVLGGAARMFNFIPSGN